MEDPLLFVAITQLSPADLPQSGRWWPAATGRNLPPGAALL